MTRRGYLGDSKKSFSWPWPGASRAYGMRIRQEIEEQSGRNVAIGAVYASIERLEDKGYIQPADPPDGPDRDPRARRFFAITPAGARAVEETAALRDRLWRGLRLRRESHR
jgi:PadR family transcriptional regulator PadR